MSGDGASRPALAPSDLRRARCGMLGDQSGELILPIATPHAAAAAYLARLAYPEPQASTMRGSFAAALHDHRVHHTLVHEGRPAALALRAPGDIRPIRRGDFQKRLDHGLDRIQRSLLVLHLYGRRQDAALCAFTGDGAAAINAAMPSWTEIIREAPDRWKTALALNETGPGGRDERETVRKLLRRTIRPCTAVLPLAYGLAAAAPPPADDAPDAIKAQLLHLSLHPELWLEAAVGLAQTYVHRPYPRGGEPELDPARLAQIVWSNADGEIARPDVVRLASPPPRRIAKPRRPSAGIQV